MKKRFATRSHLPKSSPIGSGEYPITQTSDFLIKENWIPFELDNQIRWIDPEKQFDNSYSEKEAIIIALGRKHVRK